MGFEFHLEAAGLARQAAEAGRVAGRWTDLLP